MRSMKLIPLLDGTWVSATALRSDTFFATYEQVDIPTDLGFSLVRPDATRSAVRRNLYADLGVVNCDLVKVRDEILRAHYPGQPKSLVDAVTHLRFLYWVDEELSISTYSDISGYTPTPENLGR